MRAFRRGETARRFGDRPVTDVAGPRSASRRATAPPSPHSPSAVIAARWCRRTSGCNERAAAPSGAAAPLLRLRATFRRLAQGRRSAELSETRRVAARWLRPCGDALTSLRLESTHRANAPPTPTLGVSTQRERTDPPYFVMSPSSFIEPIPCGGRPTAVGGTRIASRTRGTNGSRNDSATAGEPNASGGPSHRSATTLPGCSRGPPGMRSCSRTGASRPTWLPARARRAPVSTRAAAHRLSDGRSSCGRSDRPAA